MNEAGTLTLADVLSALADRPVRTDEIVNALGVARSTYYLQRDEGRLLTADNLLRLATVMNLNTVELMVRCGLVSPHAVVDCAGKLNTDAPGAEPARPRRRFQPRAARLERRRDLPPL